MWRPILAFVLALVVALPALPLQAQEAITILEDTQKNNWPNDITFTLKAKSSAPITRVQFQYTFGQNAVGGAGSPKFEQGTEVTAETVIRTGGSNLVPPGAAFNYTYTIEDSAGNRFRSEPKTYVYLDTRFQWKSMSDGPITIYYHDIPENRPKAFLQAGLNAIKAYNDQAAVDLKNKVNVTFYNSLPELDVAMNNRSASAQGSVLGAHYPGFYTLVATDDPRDPSSGTNTMSHETAHAITYEATRSSLSEIPAWLNEGLSVYFQESKGVEYTSILPSAARQNRLLPLRYLTAYPGKSDENLLLYGQGGSIVSYLIKQYGPAKMADLLKAFRDGMDQDRALKAVYGSDRDGIDAEWRKAMGFPAPSGTTGAPPATAQPGTNPGTNPPGNPPGNPPVAATPNPPSPPAPAAGTSPLGTLLPIVVPAAAVLVLGLFGVIGLVLFINRDRY